MEYSFDMNPIYLAAIYGTIATLLLGLLAIATNLYRIANSLDEISKGSPLDKFPNVFRVEDSKGRPTSFKRGFASIIQEAHKTKEKRDAKKETEEQTES